MRFEISAPREIRFFKPSLVQAIDSSSPSLGTKQQSFFWAGRKGGLWFFPFPSVFLPDLWSKRHWGQNNLIQCIFHPGERCQCDSK